MKNKFENGIWVTKPPQGYDIVKINNERKLVINKEGLLIRKAFLWKASGVKNEEIMMRLNAIICGICNEPFTGYVRRKRTKAKILEFYYYKCRTNGCKCNKSAEKLNKKFGDMLENFSISDEYMPAIQFELERLNTDSSKDKMEQKTSLERELAVVEKKIEDAEESLLLNKVTTAVFEKFISRYQQERRTINEQLIKCTKSISNLPEAISLVLDFSRKLNTAWSSANVTQKEELQKLIFPEGIVYEKEKGAFRTPKINFIFQLITHQLGDSAYKEEGDYHMFYDKSPFADQTGLEPATSAVTGRHSNQLNY